jgi:hypothetical protein
MLEFLKSDVGKVALGGIIAVSGQLAVTLIAWLKEARFAARAKRKEAEYLAMRLVLLFDGLVSGCYNAVHDPLREDEEGVSESTAPNPTLKLPEEGDYKVLPRHLMYEILSMPNRIDGIEEGLASAWEFSFGPDYEEFFQYRREHFSELGLKALDVIDALCRLYRIPPPERPEYYAPRTSFQDEIASVKKYQAEMEERNRAMTAGLFASGSSNP